MLNKKQLLKLILLTSDDRYGQLLADSIDAWKIYDYEFGTYGVNLTNHKFMIKHDHACCLLGANVVDKVSMSDVSIAGEIVHKYKLFNSFEAYDIANGFDDNGMVSVFFPKAFEFGKKVRKAILENK